jgi:hypothetical protein
MNNWNNLYCQVSPPLPVDSSLPRNDDFEYINILLLNGHGHHRLLKTHCYQDVGSLRKALKDGLIDIAEAKAAELETR